MLIGGGGGVTKTNGGRGVWPGGVDGKLVWDEMMRERERLLGMLHVCMHDHTYLSSKTFWAMQLKLGSVFRH
jgi:hypothetical protein